MCFSFFVSILQQVGFSEFFESIGSFFHVLSALTRNDHDSFFCLEYREIIDPYEDDRFRGGSDEIPTRFEEKILSSIHIAVGIFLANLIERCIASDIIPS